MKSVAYYAAGLVVFFVGGSIAAVETAELLQANGGGPVTALLGVAMVLLLSAGVSGTFIAHGRAADTQHGRRPS